MAEELQTLEIRDNFYRDSFGKVLFIIISLLIAILFLIAISIYLYRDKPKPVTFGVYPEWRVQQAVPLYEPHLSQPDMLQWVSDAIRQSFVLDFYNYNEQIKRATRFFTPNGWKVFLGHLNIYANYNDVQKNRTFINAVPAAAPFILNQGVLTGRYIWWVQMPITLRYVDNTQSSSRDLTLQVLVVRVSTLTNLVGVGIDNVIVVSGATGNREASANR